ncbi:WD40-repeat-containing domain protein [Lipomyces kononenkoae]|uniref:WD40-repeat-containing domain protein n=1 Tax=Lipomyces kononenkoae TaxID=34357 RepID=A0ACC3T0W5_LIPKO
MQYQSTILTHPCLARDQASPFFRAQRTREYREQLGSATPRGGGGGGAAAGSAASASSIVRTLAWNALGNRIAAVSSPTIHGGTGTHIIRIWNPERADARYSTELKGHSGAIDCVAWDPTLSDRLVSCSAADGMVRLWDARLNRTLQIFRAGTAVGIEPVFVRFTPDGVWIIVCGVRGRKLAVLNSATFQVVDAGVFTDSRPQDGDITRATVDFSGDVVAIAYSSGIVKLYSFDRATGEIGPDPVVSLNAHRTAITCLEFDPWGKYMALGSNDSLVSIWDVQELVCVRTFAKFAQAVKCISISFDGAYMAISVEGAEPIEIVHVETGEYLYSVPRGSAFHVPALEWHPTKYWLAYAGDPGGLKILGTPDDRR